MQAASEQQAERVGQALRRWTAGARRHGWPALRNGRHHAWLGRASRRLDELNEQTAGAFLTAGEHLQTLHAATQRMQGAGADAAELTGGASVQAHLDALQSLADGLAEPLQAAEQRLEAFVAALKPLADGLASAREAVDAFARVPLGLRMVALSARIETARLPGHLRDGAMRGGDILEHAERVRDTLERIGNRLGAAEARVQSTARWLPRAAEALARERAGAFDALQSVSGELARNRARGQEVAERINAETAAVAKAVSGIVSAMQVQDLARQRLEHVQQALAPESLPARAGALRSVCGLQAAQVEACRDALCEEIRHIRANFGEVQERAESMRAAAIRLGGDGGSLDAGSLGEVRSRVGDVLQALRAYEERNSQAAEAVQEVRGLAEELRPLVEEAERIAQVVRLVSLNASVSTAALGEAGATLDKVAEAIRGLASDTTDHRAALQGALTRIQAAAAELPADDAAVLEAADTESRLARLLEALEKSQQDASARLEAMRQEGTGIANVVKTALAEFTVEQTADETLSALRQELEAGAAGSGSRGAAMLRRTAHLLGLRSLAAGSATASLDVLAGNYTSYGERELHERWRAAADSPRATHDPAASALLNGQPERGQTPDAAPLAAAEADGPGAPDAAPPGGEGGDDDLGENVELF